MQLAAIVTSNPERQDLARATHPGARIVEKPGQLFGDKAVDLIVISTPNRTHVPLALAAMRAGRSVVVDKPLAPSSHEARELVTEAYRQGVLLTVYQNRRWDGDFLTIQRLVADGELGDVQRFESRLDRWRPQLKGGWRELGAPDEAGGLLFDLGTHIIDQALYLFGDVTDVYAEIDARRTGAEADDDVFVALTHASGVRSHLWASLLAAQEGPRFRVLGNRAAYTKVTSDPQEAALRRGESPNTDDWGADPAEHYGLLGMGAGARPIPTERGDYRWFYAGVARSLRDGAPPPVDPGDAIATLEIIEKAMRFAKRS